MPNAIFSFLDRDAGRVAADRLVHAGLPSQAVVLHLRNRDVNSAAHTGMADELVTGGLLSNIEHLFQGVFAEHSPSDDAANHADTVGLGSAVVTVTASDEAQQTLCDGIMKDAGYARRTPWGAATGGANDVDADTLDAGAVAASNPEMNTADTGTVRRLP